MAFLFRKLCTCIENWPPYLQQENQQETSVDEFEDDAISHADETTHMLPKTVVSHSKQFTRYNANDRSKIKESRLPPSVAIKVGYIMVYSRFIRTD